MQSVAKEYGFGSATGVGLPNEYAGKVPTPESYVKDNKAHPNIFTQSQWYPGNSDQLARIASADALPPNTVCW